jgi:amino acid permease
MRSDISVEDGAVSPEPLLEGERRRGVSIVESFKPSFASPRRKGTVMSSVFSLVSTILGGGVLSLPFAFSEAGIIPGIFLLLAVAAASDFSAFTLAACSRRAAAHTYEDVAALAFGSPGRTLAQMLVVMLTFLALIAYSILLRGILGTFIQRRAVVLLLVGGLELTILPLAMLTSFSKLRFTSLLCFCSVLGVALCVMLHFAACVADPEQKGLNRELLWPDNAFGIFRALPVLICTFLCHFNLLAVHGELENPSRGRVKSMVHGAVGAASSIYFTIGISGAAFSSCRGKDPSDNILTEFNPSTLPGKVALTLAKCGILATLLFALPMIAAPCRDTMLRLWSTFWDATSDPADALLPLGHEKDEIGNPLVDDTSMAASAGGVVNGIGGGSGVGAGEGDSGGDGDSSANMVRAVRDYSADTDSSSIGISKAKVQGTSSLTMLTLVIFALQFAIASVTPNVSTVWAFIGSIVGPIIAFVIPAASYLMITSPSEIQGRKHWRRFSSWLLLVSSVCAMFVCTYITIYDIASSPPR